MITKKNIMKKLILLLSIMLVPIVVIGQSTDQNYIETTFYKEAKQENEILNTPEHEKINTINY